MSSARRRALRHHGQQETRRRRPAARRGQVHPGAVRQRLAVVVIVLLGAALSASPAHAAAEVTSFSFGPTTQTFAVSGYFCLPDGVGTATQTAYTTGQTVQAASGQVSVHGKTVYDIRVDFPDGSYVQSGRNRDVFAFTPNSPLTVFTHAIIDVETIYNAQGQPVGKIAIHETLHATFRDLNGNHQPDEGEITVAFDRFRLRCT
jgi:hypothetical protein